MTNINSNTVINCKSLLSLLPELALFGSDNSLNNAFKVAKITFVKCLTGLNIL